MAASQRPWKLATVLILTYCISHSHSSQLNLTLSKAQETSVIDQRLLEKFKADGTASIFIKMIQTTHEILDNYSESSYEDRPSLIKSMRDSLRDHSESTQQHLRSYLQSKQIDYKPLWITNQIYISNATLDLAEELSTMPGILQILEEEFIPLEPLIDLTIENEITLEKTDAIQWNIEDVGARCVWDRGNRGGGIVVGNIDTGVKYSHVILASNHREEYGWFLPRPQIFNSTEFDLTRPFDNNGHGTHTMGTIVGGRGYGVAPDAKWIACKGCTGAGCTQFDLFYCGQFMFCPDFGVKACRTAPDVVNNSWGGGQGTVWYETILRAWIIAGIIPVFSQGNRGPKCSTANSPGDNQYTIGVGATDIFKNISSFSSKGPHVRTHALKPDISAPGRNIISAYIANGTTGFAKASGTSMASPHVAGVVALIRAAGICEEYVSNNYANGTRLYQCVYDAITKHASTNFTVNKLNVCGGRPESVVPNYSYGHGIVNAFTTIYGPNEKCL